MEPLQFINGKIREGFKIAKILILCFRFKPIIDLKNIFTMSSTDLDEYDIFMSYHPDILKQVENIHDRFLEDNNTFRIWLKVINSNEESNNDLIKIVKNATIFLCFVTEAYSQSERCRKEIELADKTHALIIFTMVEKVENENLGYIEAVLKKSRGKCLKCYDCKSNWWIEKFEDLKKLILEVKI